MLFRFAACAALLASARARNIARQGSVTTDEDVTVTVTVTAKNPPTSTAFETTTIFKTVFSTIVVTKTQITTETETKKDVATATSVIYTTVTQNAKRWINADPAPAAAREVPPATLTVDAAPGPQTTPIEDFMGGPNVELLIRKAVIAKRATVTTTVTVIADGITTVFRTVSSTVVSTTSSETTSISKLTTTTFENAKTTVTVTSTLFLKTTTVTTGPAQTVDSVPPDANIGTDNPQATDSSNSGNGGGSKKNKGGLSTGAKAGIGAAAGGVGLMIIVALAMYFWKQHKNKPKVTDDGTGMGMSEVPVGGIGAAGTSGAATETVGSPRFTPSPVTSTLPTGSPVYNTTGPAELGGLPKKPDAELEGDELPPDNTPVMDHRSGPVDPIYEMPAQEYR